ncbi:hypothetical protein ACQKNB_16660 [Lysinibacillus xylanilyticus]|uniref:hypothetical protein n=1 Tax=Lysinibacillus xylanilyticus TaxID=582475 RepID=UPI003D0721D0
MEITYYFYNHFHSREGIEDFLLDQVKNITGNENNLSYTKQEESEEGEGDTLYVKCDFFSFTTTLFDVKSVSRDYDLKINYGLECNIYENGTRKFIEFLGNFLKSNIGHALLLKNSEYRVLERKGDFLIVDSHFFYSDFEALNLPYIQGIYKSFWLKIYGNFTTEEIKLESIRLVENHKNESMVGVIEDPDYLSEFTINWVDLQFQISNVGTAINITCSHIFTFNDETRIKKMLCLFKKFTTKFTGDYRLMLIQGYWEQKRSVLLERKHGNLIVNDQLEEAKLLHEII